MMIQPLKPMFRGKGGGGTRVKWVGHSFTLQWTPQNEQSSSKRLIEVPEGFWRA